MKSKERVEAWMNSGRIDAQEGQALLHAMEGRGAFPWLMVSPFAQLPPFFAWAITAVVWCATLVLGTSGVRFDGFFDVHLGMGSLAHVALGAALNLSVGVLAAWGIARAFGRPTRLMDWVWTLSVARVPLAVTAAVIIATEPALQTLVPVGGQLSPSAPGIVAATLISGFAIWSCVWAGTAFQFVSGLRGAKLFLGIGAFFVLAELVSKTLWVSFL